MAAPSSRPVLPSIVICGSQTIPPRSQFLEELGHQLRGDPEILGLKLAIIGLPDLCTRLIQELPVLQVNEARYESHLRSLARWITEDDYELVIPENLPNVILAPLTVIIHIVQYFRHLDVVCTDDYGDSHTLIVQSVQRGGFQGLCSGFLTAAALTSSANKAELIANASTAIRLAFCIAAYIDLGETTSLSPDGTRCLIVERGTELGETEANCEIDTIIGSFPQAYISVELNERSLTITVPASDVAPLRKALTDKGARTTLIPIRGRYHTENHSRSLQELMVFCETKTSLQFSRQDKPLAPLRYNTSGTIVTGEEPLHETCLRCLLTERANWHAVMIQSESNLVACKLESPSFLELGISGSLARGLGGVTNLTSIPHSSVNTRTEDPQIFDYPEHSIAVIGAAGRFAGADSLDQLWEIIRSGRSEEGPAPDSRSTTTNNGSLANYMTSVSKFDHDFFGISPREAQYMDPQQRIALQVAYQTVHSSNNFAKSEQPPDANIGCYVGVAGSDYEHNVASHKPTAFSYTGTSRAFVAGRISHHFAWEGPAMTVDTACSSSAVAIHQACKDINLGECKMALAGGVNVISSPVINDFLHAARFLDPTGPCRSFQEGAKGYCRGEGCGFVLLKKLSAAMADGDEIMGVIAGSGSNQCDPASSITVPSSAAQMKLQRKVLSQAGMSPTTVSYVEAHGTGTAKGDPIECQSIRKVFGRSSDDPKLALGTVKANIGHTEAASGVAALLKVLLMLQHKAIPPQPKFSGLNKNIAPLCLNNIDIPVQERVWDAKFRAACVNNYGASGSNAVLLLCESPKRPVQHGHGNTVKRHPLLISSHSTRALHEYCKGLETFLANSQLAASDLAFGLSRRQDRALSHKAAFKFDTVGELREQLSRYILGPHIPKQRQRPVVLVFAGQSRDTVRFSKAAYEGSSLLRYHLNQCDELLRSLGRRSMLPEIFSSEPIEDVVLLHSIIFSLQYSCAAAWLDSGLPVERVIGQSIGQLTAMCIAGVVTLSDALKLIVGRASLIQNKWGPEKGSMLAVDIDRQGAKALAAAHDVEIACFNGPSRHVLVGTEAAIQDVEASTGCRVQRVRTTNGYHSALMDCLMDDYLQLAQSITYASPRIPIETCSEGSGWSKFTPELVAQHSRGPVFVWDAIERIEKDLGECVWIEGGSFSSGVSLVKSALDAASRAGHSFHGAQLGNSNPLDHLADMTVKLWDEGINVSFWLYHHSERHRYSPLALPGYQFDETDHWVSYLDKGTSKPAHGLVEQPLISLAQHPARSSARFEFVINQCHAQYVEMLQSRQVLGERLFPVAFYLELASQAVLQLSFAGIPLANSLQWQNIRLHAALGCRIPESLHLRFEKSSSDGWEFGIFSSEGSEETTHCTASLSSPNVAHAMSKAAQYSCFEDVLSNPEAAAVQGHLVYKLLGQVAEYNIEFRGIKSLAIAGLEAAAVVEVPLAARNRPRPLGCHPAHIDQFFLVAEIHALALESCGPSDAYLCREVGMVSEYLHTVVTQGSWKVYTRCTRKCDSELVCDTFIFDMNESLVMTISNAIYVKVPLSTLRSIFDRAKGIITPEPTDEDRCGDNSTDEGPDLYEATAELIYETTGIPPERLSSLTSITAAGVDSLAVTELESRIREVFNVEIRVDLSDSEYTFGQLCGEIQSCRVKCNDIAIQFTPTSGTSSSSYERQIPNDTFTALIPILGQYLSTASTLHAESELKSMGLDSLVSIELEASLHEAFGVRIDLMGQSDSLTVGDLAALLLPSGEENSASVASRGGLSGPFLGNQAVELFGHVRHEVGSCARLSGFEGFYETVYPRQTELVLTYVIEALSALGCNLQSLEAGQEVPAIEHMPRHSKVISHFWKLAEESGLVVRSAAGFLRTSKTVHLSPSSTLYPEMLRDFPQYKAESQLLSCTGPRLADCLSGQADPLHLLFGSPQGVQLMQDVYKNTPMFKMGTLMLGRFLTQILPHAGQSRVPITLLEIGAGTGGTTEYILEQLTACGIPFQYTFTDISPALVARARKTFAKYPNIEYTTLDIENLPDTANQTYDVIISSNCIHATKDLTQSCHNCYKLLNAGGIVCLLELTRDLWWLDCVFGLLEGWWLFEDKREHVLASESFWKETLLAAGFGHVDWSNDGSRESDAFRLIVAQKD
ncbi:unnamed protein product [Penicillium olsonii]|nr:unnamed protein product [Penicillium olsonii]